jgi:phage terminase large subunit-like protein
MSIATWTAPAPSSLADSMSWLSAAERAELIGSLTDRQADDLLRDWRVWARPSQLPPPGDWRFWLLMAGRGFGKTRSAAEYVREEVRAGRAREVMLIAATAADVRDVVVEGPSGIVAVCERAGWPCHYEPSKHRISFANGAVARTRSADEPDRIRGPECDLAWWDEFGVWRHEAAYQNADFGLRRVGPKGHRARAVVAFTPRPTALVKELVTRPDAVLVRGHTDENAANLDPATVASLHARYGGTRLGRQELSGELLEDVEGALWTLALIDRFRLPGVPAGVELVRTVVGVDPPGTKDGAECGIVVAGRGTEKRGYVLADRSRRGTPNEWATAAVAAHDAFAADAVVIEVNQGGDMATNTLRSVRPHLRIVEVRASKGKQTRAEPIAALYEQGHVSHVGSHPSLEDQMSSWVPGDESPDRMDALVWALTEALAPLLRPPAVRPRVR